MQTMYYSGVRHDPARQTVQYTVDQFVRMPRSMVSFELPWGEDIAPARVRVFGESSARVSVFLESVNSRGQESVWPLFCYEHGTATQPEHTGPGVRPYLYKPRELEQLTQFRNTDISPFQESSIPQGFTMIYRFPLTQGHVLDIVGKKSFDVREAELGVRFVPELTVARQRGYPAPFINLSLQKIDSVGSYSYRWIDAQLKDQHVPLLRADAAVTRSLLAAVN